MILDIEMRRRWNKNSVRNYQYKIFAILLFVFSTNTNAEFISYTGKYKVHDAKCYEQVVRSPPKKTDWQEFDCISYFESKSIDSEIMNIIKTYYDLMKGNKLSKDAYMKILDASMNALNQKEYFKREIILNDLHSAILVVRKNIR